MIRLFKTHAKFLLLMLIMWKQLDANRNGSAARALIDQVSIWVRENSTNPIAIWVSGFDWADTVYHANVDEQMEALMEGLSDDPTNSKGDVSIISTIIEILSLPWAGNRLGSETISTLRKAILRPSEIANFQKVAKESFQCGTCNHKFMGNEAAIVQRGANHELRVNCLRCATPTYGICSSCGESAQITSVGAAALAATKFVACDCGSLKKKKEVASTDAVTFRVSTARGTVPPSSRPPVPASRQRLQDASLRAFAIEAQSTIAGSQPNAGDWASAGQVVRGGAPINLPTPTLDFIDSLDDVGDDE